MSATVGAMDILLAADNATFLKAMQQAEDRITKLTGSTRQFGPVTTSSFNQGTAAVERFGHSGVTSVQAASAALRELNGDFTNNIRAVERFITTIPGVGGALKFAFPAVGAAAFGAVIYQGVDRVRTFISEINKIPQALQTGFSSINAQANLANDALAITNDKLAMEIDKLGKKPQNGLQLAIDQVRESSDKLGVSLTSNIQKINELFEKNKIGFWGKLLTNQSGTDDTQKLVTDLQASIEAVNQTYTQTIDDATEDGASKENIVNIKTAEMARLEKVYKDAHDRIRPIMKQLMDDQYDWDRSNGGLGRNQKANIAILGGYDTMLRQQERQIGGEYLEETQTGKVDQLKTSKENGSGADAERMRKMESDLHAQQMQHEMSIKAVYDYWDRMRLTVSSGSKLYNDVVTKQAELAAEGARRAHELIQQARKKSDETVSPEESNKGVATMNNLMREQGEDVYRTGLRWREYNAQIREAAQAQARSQRSLAAFQIGNSVDAGMMDRTSAAVAMRGLNRADVSAQQEALRSQITDLTQDLANLDKGSTQYEAQMPLLTAQIQRLQNQLAQLNDTANLQDLRDQQEIFYSTSFGGATRALQEFTSAALDSSRQMQQFITSTLDGVNKNILNVLTEKPYQRRGQWRQLGHSVFSDVAGGALKRGEAGVLGAIMPSMQKLGSRGNPMWVKSADALLSKSVGGADNVMNIGNIASSTGSPSNPFSKFISGAMKFAPLLPGFENGVQNFGGGWAMVGEAGPELVNLPGGSDVIPNHKMPDFGGGGVHFHEGAIDARGSTNPAQTASMISQALHAWTPHVVAASVHAHSEHQSRLPLSKRS
jgi:lambda family phage tail tape measure protein